MSEQAIAAVMNGSKKSDISAGKARKLAEDAIKLTGKVKAKALQLRESGERLGMSLVDVGEVQVACFLPSLAEGFWGRDKMKIGGKVDYRLAIAVPIAGFGLYKAAKDGSGSHPLSLANGILASYIASLAVEAGEAIREKRGAKPPGGEPPAPPGAPPAVRGRPDADGDADIGAGGGERRSRRIRLSDPPRRGGSGFRPGAPGR